MKSRQNQITILLVENEALDPMSREKDLENYGYIVIRANSGEHAIETVEKKPGIDLILMDSDLGDKMAGAQAAEQILEKHDLPLVFKLSNPDTETLEKVESITPYGFVTRNSSVAEVNSFIKMTLRLFEANENTRKKRAELKQVEELLRKSEEKYRSLLNASPDGIFIINMKGIITDVSEIGLEIMGCESKNDLIGKHFFRFVLPDQKNTLRELVNETISDGLSQNVEIKIRKRKRGYFLSETSSTVIQDTSGLPLFMITIRDISLRKEMEKQQMHTDRMASLGEMATGMAHEINQPLNTISMTLDNVLFEQSKEGNIDKEYIRKKSEKVFENIYRIQNIIDHVRLFSSNHDDYLSTGFDINASIQGAISLVSEQLKHMSIKLNLQLGENLPLISGNTYKFEQVILNLLLNAKDAVIQKKEMAENDFDMFITLRSYRENGQVIVEVIDNGIGIPEEDIEHILLPFFTNKNRGKGIGLGLSISYRIIREMKGELEISSNSKLGTTFKIRIELDNND